MDVAFWKVAVGVAIVFATVFSIVAIRSRVDDCAAHGGTIGRGLTCVMVVPLDGDR
jgi:hypothetical protein